MSPSSRSLLHLALVSLLIVLVAVGLWKTAGHRPPDRIVVARDVQRLMGTTCTLGAVVPTRGRAAAEDVLQRAEEVLRGAESRLSTWIPKSELGRLNAAAADRHVPLSAESREVLRLARDAHDKTAGAMDVTCRPLVELWRAAAKRGRRPSNAELADARAASNWDLIELTDTGALKRSASARVDLGGIAKGYAIDRAVEVLRAGGVAGGMVDVGGDLVCFGKPPAGEVWIVEVRDPSARGNLAKLRLPGGGAVCTSGNYARYVEIAGRRYSHIIDPRTGLPADSVLSATVVARSAVVADVWATALSVLGSAGLKLLPEGAEAIIIVAERDGRRIHFSDGFEKLLKERPPEG